MSDLDLDAIRERADKARLNVARNLADHLVRDLVRNYTAGGRKEAADEVADVTDSAEDVPALLAAVRERDERIAARDRASLGALFLADAIGIENVEAEIEKAKAAAAAPYLEQIAALQAQLDAVRSWVQDNRSGPDQHVMDYEESYVAAADDVAEILASAPSNALDRVKREAAAAERREWADYLENWEATVGSPALSASRLVALLRAPRRPFGAVLNEEAPR